MDLTDFPTTLLEFEARFPTERSCWEFLWQAKWPNGYLCDRCGGRSSYFVIERGLEECTGCGRQASVTTGTMFHRCRSELRKWFRAILEFVVRKHGCNAQDIRRLVGVSEPTAWRWLHKIREAISRRPKEPLAGVVEADETYVGGSEAGVFGRDRGSKKHLIAGAVEVSGAACGRARLSPVASAKASDLQTFVGDHVVDGATVRTDGLNSYEGLDAVYKHKRIVIGDPKTASEKFPRIHRVFSLFKRVLIGTYHGSWTERYAAAYCAEFEFRFNRRNSSRRPRLVARVIEAAQMAAPSIFRKSRGSGLELGVPDSG